MEVLNDVHSGILSMSNIIAGTHGKTDHWPTFTEVQVSFLEKLFPPRCVGRRESAEDHLRYAGMVDLVAMLRGTVIGGTKLDLNEDEEDALDDEVVSIAEQTQE